MCKPTLDCIFKTGYLICLYVWVAVTNRRETLKSLVLFTAQISEKKWSRIVLLFLKPIFCLESCHCFLYI